MIRTPFTHAILVTAFLMMGGCCHPDTVVKPPLNPPAPITVQEQLERLNQRAAAISRLILDAKNISGGGITLTYLDEHDKQHREDVEGRLILRQSVANVAGMGAPQSTPVSDIFVSLRKVGQEGFRAGTGDNKWWFIVFIDQKKAWWGESSSHETPRGVIRPDQLIPMLGVTPIFPAESQFVAMRVEDSPLQNSVMIFREQTPGIGSIEREVIVDRITGDITEIRLYDSHGRPVISSKLSGYTPVELPGGNPGPRIARHIVVTMPTQKAIVRLDISDAKIPESVNDSLFKLPDFEALGVTVQTPAPR